MVPTSILAGTYFGTLVFAQYFPPTPSGHKVLQSKFHDGVTISYKEVSNKVQLAA